MEWYSGAVLVKTRAMEFRFWLSSNPDQSLAGVLAAIKSGEAGKVIFEIA